MGFRIPSAFACAAWHARPLRASSTISRPFCGQVLLINGCNKETLTAFGHSEPEVSLRISRFGVEGCLSFPGVRSDVIRPAAVRVRAQSLDGKMLEFEAGGLLARAIQHEHDHLHGILFIDRVSAAERERIEAEMIDAADRV